MIVLQFIKCSFKSVSTKNKADGKSISTTPVLTDAIKKRTERFGDISQAAKANAMNVCKNFFFFNY
jgi:hypothetical protein